MPGSQPGVRKYQKKAAYSVAALNKKVNKLARDTKPEKKHAIFNGTPGNIDDTGTIQPLVAIPRGDTDQTRIGVRVRLTSMQGRARIQATGVSCATVRVILYRDRNSLVTVPASILRYVASGQAVISPYADDTRQDFQVLMDKTFQVSPGQSNDAVTFNFGRKLGKKVLWNDSDVIEQGDIKMLAISSHPAGSSSKPTFAISGQFFYTDV